MSAPLAMLLAAVGALVAIDTTSVGQVMISRPIVAATLGGWIAGSPESGAAIGLLLEALQLDVLPVGAARYPESGPPALIGGAMLALRGGGFADLLLITLFCLFWEWVCGLSVQGLRHVNARFSVPADAGRISARELSGAHARAIGLDIARGAAMTLLGLAVLHSLTVTLPPLHVAPSVARSLVYLFVAVGAAGVLRIFGTRFAGWAAGGAAVAGLVLWLR